MSVTREDLFKQVWAEPMTSVAARYEVSSSFLARVCERMKVPRPPRGYWARLKAGKPRDQPDLPSPQPGDELEWCRKGEPRRVPIPLPKPPTLEPRATESKPRRRTSKHGLVLGVEDLFHTGRVSDAGYLKPNKQLLVDAFTSKPTLARALNTLSDVFLALEDRGHDVRIAPNGTHYRRPQIDHRQEPNVIGLAVYEISENVEVRRVEGKYVRVSPRKAHRSSPTDPWREWTTRQDMPTGRLCLVAFAPYPRAPWEKRWSEERSGTLKKLLNEVVAEIEGAATVVAEQVEEGERQAVIERRRREEEHRRWEQEEAERRRVTALKDSREQLLQIIDAWALATNIDTFFQQAMDKVETLNAADREKVAARLERARELFGAMHPLDHFRRWLAPEER